MRNVSRWAAFVWGGIVVLGPALQARTCSGNGDLIGGYGWMGSRTQEVVPASSASAVTVVTPVVGSVTRIGSLTAGAQNTAAFASVGRLYLDGNGGMFSSSAPGAALVQVGAYSVNLDCTVSATFTDSFATAGSAGLTAVQASATFQGVAVQNANEVELLQTGASAATVLTLRKAKQINGCSNDGLSGTFGVAAAGVSTTSVISGAVVSTTTSPFRLIGRLNADGQGNFVQDTAGLASPLTKLQFTGTYSVNLDCSGTATLVSSDAKSRKIDFVLVSPGGSSSGNGAQTLTFAFTDAGAVGSGLAQQQ